MTCKKCLSQINGQCFSCRKLLALMQSSSSQVQRRSVVQKSSMSLRHPLSPGESSALSAGQFRQSTARWLPCARDSGLRSSRGCKCLLFYAQQNNDATNFWALNKSALTKCLELVGFREIRQLRMIVPVQGLSMHMTRINLIAPEAGKTIRAALCSPRYKGEAVRLRLKSPS
jgi:hypothetical protein